MFLAVIFPATDIFDKELNDLRKQRWEKAFAMSNGSEGEEATDGAKECAPADQNGLQAMIVIERTCMMSIYITGWFLAGSNTLLFVSIFTDIIQASDVSHTMQHWHVYTKWNRNLFQEMRHAFKEGRMAVDPATFW